MSYVKPQMTRLDLTASVAGCCRVYTPIFLPYPINKAPFGDCLVPNV